MKIRNGKAVLGKNDTRIGNYVISREEHYFKLQDIGGFWSLRINRFLMEYTLIEECLKADNKKYLEAMIKMYYAVTTTPPDKEMLKDMFDAYSALMDRMRKQMPEVSDAEQEQIVKEVAKSLENKETVLKAIEDGAPANQEG